MKRVLITGSSGTIGSVLKSDLPYDTTDFDLPDKNVKDLTQLVESARGHDVIVHLAWNKKHDDWLTENFDQDNLRNEFNVYEAASLAGVKRVIMASSVHADDFVKHTRQGMLKPYDLPIPDSPYGASKCMLEALGRYYAHAKGLEVVCVRYGGVNKLDVAPTHPESERQVWLSQRDCLSLVTKIIDVDSVFNNYAIVYAVSDNEGRLHDISNPFDWQPQDSAPAIKSK